MFLFSGGHIAKEAVFETCPSLRTIKLTCGLGEDSVQGIFLLLAVGKYIFYSDISLLW